MYVNESRVQPIVITELVSPVCKASNQRGFHVDMPRTKEKRIQSNNSLLHRFGWDIRGYYHRTLTAFFELVS